MNADLDPEFNRAPLEFVNGIPVFSRRDAYVANYERIAADHVKAMEGGVENPFMDIELWKQSEDSTRRLIAATLAEGSKVLDVGVGLGRVMGPLNQFHRYGIDISIDYLKHARARGLQVAFARIEDMPFADSSFDAAVVCDVLEHVLDLNACVQQILRVIKPGGLLIVRVPYKEDLSGYLDPSMPYEFVHLRNFDEQSLRLFFEKVMRCRVEHVELAAPCLSPDRLKLRLPEREGFLRALAQRLQEAAPAPAAVTEPAPLPVAQLPGLFARLVAAIRGVPWSTVVPTETPQAPPPVDSSPEHPLGPLLKMTVLDLDQDQVYAWLSDLVQQHPDWAQMLLPHVTEALEINVVVRKPPLDRA